MVGTLISKLHCYFGRHEWQFRLLRGVIFGSLDGEDIAFVILVCLLDDVCHLVRDGVVGDLEAVVSSAHQGVFQRLLLVVVLGLALAAAHYKL